MAWEDRAYNREDQASGSGPKLIFPMPSKLTFALIIACVIVFFVERLTGPAGESISQYGFFSFANGFAYKQPWRWLTYQYMHGGGMHLFWNILSIYFFVPPLERLW